jgi:hypothetical protein
MQAGEKVYERQVKIEEAINDTMGSKLKND